MIKNFKMALTIVLSVLLIPVIALFIANGQMDTYNEQFLSAISRNDTELKQKLTSHGVTFAQFCADDLKHEFDDICGYLEPVYFFKLASIATIGLGAIAIIISLIMPLVFGLASLNPSEFETRETLLSSHYII